MYNSTAFAGVNPATDSLACATGVDSSITAPDPIVLRPYQDDAVELIRTEFATYRRVLFALPTGGGKTVIFSYITQSASGKGRSVIVVAHRKEICRQISRALDAMGVQHGLIMSGQ